MTYFANPIAYIQVFSFLFEVMKKRAMFFVVSLFVINVPTRDLLVPYKKRSFQIMVGTLALQLAWLVIEK